MSTRGRGPRRAAPRAGMAGFSIIEVLVALVVLSVGLLGIAGLYVVTLQSGGTAIYRTQAVNLAADMADRIRANRTAGVAYAAGASGALACTGAGAVDCSPADLAGDDVLQWNTELAAALPNGQGVIQVAGAGAPFTYTITVTWSEAGQAANSSYTMTVQV
jgi:type IV pilus assembly protein PilV